MLSTLLFWLFFLSHLLHKKKKKRQPNCNKDLISVHEYTETKIETEKSLGLKNSNSEKQASMDALS